MHSWGSAYKMKFIQSPKSLAVVNGINMSEEKDSYTVSSIKNNTD